MKYYHTNYTVGRSTFSTGFYAIDEEEAKKLCISRNIGEKIDGTSDKPSLGLKNVLETLNDESIHLIAFCSWIVLKSKDYTIDDVLRDDGILHELIHAKSGIDTTIDTTKLKEKMKKLVMCAYNAPEPYL